MLLMILLIVCAIAALMGFAEQHDAWTASDMLHVAQSGTDWTPLVVLLLSQPLVLIVYWLLRRRFIER